jgi:predicted phosphoadenosine phosphosulfate sulfurtransferase
MPENPPNITATKLPSTCAGSKKGVTEIPDSQPGDIGAKDIPSWRRICKVLLNNDYWCRALSFSPTKTSNYKRYHERIKNKRKEWGYYATAINQRN